MLPINKPCHFCSTYIWLHNDMVTVWDLFVVSTKLLSILVMYKLNSILSRASEAGSPTNRLGSDKTRGQGSFGPSIGGPDLQAINETIPSEPPKRIWCVLSHASEAGLHRTARAATRHGARDRTTEATLQTPVVPLSSVSESVTQTTVTASILVAAGEYSIHCKS